METLDLHCGRSSSSVSMRPAQHREDCYNEPEGNLIPLLQNGAYGRNASCHLCTPWCHEIEFLHAAVHVCDVQSGHVSALAVAAIEKNIYLAHGNWRFIRQFGESRAP